MQVNIVESNFYEMSHVPSPGVETMGRLKSLMFLYSINYITGSWVLENGFSIGTRGRDLIFNPFSIS